MGSYKLTGLGVATTSGDALSYGNTITSTLSQKLMFYAENSADQTVTGATLTKVTVAEILDPNSNFASSRHTPTTAGYYRYFGTLSGLSGGGGSLVSCQLAFYKNGAIVRTGASLEGLASTLAAVNIYGEAVIQMNGTTDYVEMFGLVDATGTCKFAGSAPAITSFGGEYISA